GLFAAAGEGIIFLDEIGELPLQIQPHLLRVLQDGEYRRVGSNQTMKANCKVIAATNCDL
ncbi:MAG: sigma 54-interacting transcriptional regulator, partial [Thermodesulfovibrionales bacterium]